LVPVFGPGGGIFAQYALEAAGMTANKNTIPKDPSTPFYPSGLRLGTPAITSRKMKEKEMKKIGKWIALIVNEIKHYRLPTTTKEERLAYISNFKKEIEKNKIILRTRQEIKNLCKKFPVPGKKL